MFQQTNNQRTEGPERHSNVHLMIVVQVAVKLKKINNFPTKAMVEIIALNAIRNSIIIG